MSCPICDTTLERVTLLQADGFGTDLRGFGCPEGHGVFLPSDFYFDWRDRRRPSEGLDLTAVSGDFGDAKRAKLCPQDGRIMLRYRSGGKRGFWIDRCGTCGGAWFDGSEWEATVAAGLHERLPWVFSDAWQREAEEECYRVEWSAAWSDGEAYQSEAWCPTEKGVLVAYKGVGAAQIDFDQPYLMLARSLEASTTWSDSMLVNGNSLSTLDAFVGDEERVQTPAGDYQAVRVTLRVRGGEIDRWYTRGVGMVREATHVVVGEERMLIEDKRLSKRLP